MSRKYSIRMTKRRQALRRVLFGGSNRPRPPYTFHRYDQRTGRFIGERRTFKRKRDWRAAVNELVCAVLSLVVVAIIVWTT